MPEPGVKDISWHEDVQTTPPPGALIQLGPELRRLVDAPEDAA